MSKRESKRAAKSAIEIFDKPAVWADEFQITLPDGSDIAHSAEARSVAAQVHAHAARAIAEEAWRTGTSYTKLGVMRALIKTVEADPY